MTKLKFRIGDTVTITRPGQVYSSSSHVAKELKLTKFHMGHGYSSGHLRSGDTGFIVGYSLPSDGCNEVRYALEIKDHQFIMGGDGMELLSPFKPLSDDLFEL